MAKIKDLDYRIAYYFPKLYHHKNLNNTMKFITGIGDLGLVWLTIILILSINSKTRILSQKMLFALIITTIVGQVIIKLIVKRKRPCQSYHDIEMLIPIPQDYSFPSSHTTSSFACATTVCFFYPHIGLVCLLFAGLMAFSRLYLFVHYFSDVIFAIILGVFVGIIVTVI